MQNGSLIETKRRCAPSLWEFRWRDRTGGRPVYRRIVLGTTEQFTTEAEARGAVKGIVLEINSDDPRIRTDVLTMSQLIEHHRRREPSIDNTWKASVFIHGRLAGTGEGDRCREDGHLGTHVFPHTHRSWLDAVGSSAAVQQKMMRHADIQQ